MKKVDRRSKNVNIGNVLPSAFFALTSKAPLGVRGERAAAKYLCRCGYTIVAGGHRTRYGEIDLIAVDHHRSRRFRFSLSRGTDRKTVVFVEVKTRRSHRAGHPASAVGYAKQRRITDGALAFLKSHGLLEYPARFDVMAIVWPHDARRPESIEHFQNAFEPPKQWQFFA